ncbi:hypothetical protein SERLA73DRAFT_91147, partial [Serpula lacrymans var. lacrymans S7.3]
MVSWDSWCWEDLPCVGFLATIKIHLYSFLRCPRSRIIDHLIRQRRNDSVAAVFIYCNYMEQAVQTVHSLLASLLKQLVQVSQPVFDRVKSHYETDRKQGVSPNIHDVFGTLKAEIKSFPEAFIVVDALDEVTEDDDTCFELLRKLQSLEVNLLITSRDLDSIRLALPDVEQMPIHAHDDDMRRVIEGRIDTRTSLRTLIAKDPSLREEIINELIVTAREMFLLCSLYIELLSHKMTPRAIRTALQNLPKEVHGAYDETMKRIRGQGPDCLELA